MKKPTLKEWMANAQLDFDFDTTHITLLDPPIQTLWCVQVGRYSKGAYKPIYSMHNAAQAMRYYHCINIGNGYKKRLLRVSGAKTLVVAKQAS